MATKTKKPQQKQSQKSQDQGSKSQNPQQLQKRVNATLKRLESKDPGLKELLNKAYGYAVFPSVGKAALVVGGAYGRGAVFEKGKMIGYATISQMTIGVQIGGDTFTEILVFHDKQPLKRFKQGHMAFAANASAVLVKAAAAGTSDFKGVSALAYSSGGMLLELSLGGQKFTFKPLGSEQDDDEQDQKKGGAKAKGRSGDEEADEQGGEQDDEGEEGGGMLSQALDGVKGAASSVGGIAKERPVVATIVGAGLVTGLALLVMRALRSSGGSQSDEEDDEESEDDDTDARASDESEDEEEEDEGEEDEEEEGSEDEASDEEEDEEESSNNHVGGKRSHRYR